MHTRHRWIFVAMLLAACGDTPLTGGGDAASPDLAAARDLATGDDLAATPDLATSDLAGAVDNLAPAGDLATAYTLTVTRSGSGTGGVTSTDSAINCGAVCGAAYLAGSTVTLSAAPSVALATQSTFVGWSGAGCSGTGTCVVSMTQAQSVTAQFRLDANIAFVTNATFSPDFGSPQNADALCAAAAAAASRTGTYKALVSSASSNAKARFGAAAGWVRLDGRPFASSLADIQNATVYNPLRISETGLDVGQVGVWTGSNVRSQSSGTDCQGWTSVASNVAGDTGQSSATGTMSIAFNALNCAHKAPLYCFGVDRTTSVAPPPPPATRRTAFVSNGTFATTGGLAGADALCASEALAAGLSGTYAALLPDIGASAGSRFDTSGAAWVRPDGVVVHQDVAGMFTTALWDAPINVTASGAIYLDNNSVWGGTSRPNIAGVAGNTCQGWTSTSASDSAPSGRIAFSDVASALSLDSSSTCGQAFRVFCLQQ